MKITQLVGRAGYIAVKQLTRVYGVECDIYFPIKANNLKHGYRDDDIEYPLEANETVKVLIPALFRKRVNNDALIEDFENTDTFMYGPKNLDVPNYSKIITRLKSGKILNYKVDEIDAISDDEVDLVFRKYKLIPVTSIDINRNREEFQDMLELEDERASEGLFLTNTSLISETLNRGTVKNKYDPIK